MLSCGPAPCVGQVHGGRLNTETSGQVEAGDLFQASHQLQCPPQPKVPPLSRSPLRSAPCECGRAAAQAQQCWCC